MGFYDILENIKNDISAAEKLTLINDKKAIFEKILSDIQGLLLGLGDDVCSEFDLNNSNLNQIDKLNIIKSVVDDNLITINNTLSSINKAKFKFSKNKI